MVNFVIFLAGSIVGAIAVFFVMFLVKPKRFTDSCNNCSDTEDVRQDEVLKTLKHFEKHHINWRSPKATKIAVEKLFETIRNL